MSKASTSERVLRDRSALVADRALPPGPRGAAGAAQEVLVKAIGYARSMDSVRNMLRYVGRLRQEDRDNGLYGTVPLRDEAGGGVPGEAIGAVLREWAILPDHLNLTPAAGRRPAPRPEAANRMDDADRFRHAQTAHLTWSINLEKTGLEAPRAIRAMEASTLALVDEMFTSRGVPVIWGLHDEQAGEEDRRDPAGIEATHPHVHLIAPLMPPGADPWRVDRAFLEELRHAAARHGRAQGLNLVASRREDRPDLVEDIVGGREKLRPRAARRASAAGAAPADLARKAPLWFVEEGPGYERRKLELLEARRAARTEAAALPAAERQAAVDAALAAALERRVGRATGAVKDRLRVRALPEPLQGLRDLVKESYEDPAGAVLSYWRLAVEGAYRDGRGRWRMPNRSIADWHLRKRPEMFGAIRPKALAHPVREDLRACLRELKLPLREELVKGEREAVPEALAKSVAEAERLSNLREVRLARDVIVASTRDLARMTGDILMADHRAAAISKRADEISRMEPGSAPTPAPATASREREQQDPNRGGPPPAPRRGGGRR